MRAIGALFLLCVVAVGAPVFGEDMTDAHGAAARSATPIDTQPTRMVSKKRIALVVGNSNYENVVDLRNPTNDAQALGTVLRRVGFDVTVGLDLNAGTFRRTIQKFLERIDHDTVALFFYAGHGLQVNGLNYMLPTDVKLASLSDLEFETIRFNLLLEPMEQNSSIGIVFLDACRDNPLASSLSGASKDRSLRSRGLAPVQTGDGLFIGFATQPDNVAADGDGPNSPFTTALLHHLETPGFDIEMLMRRVRDDVLASTNRGQIPWSNSSLSSEGFSFKPADIAGPPSVAAPQDPGASDRQLELELWRSISESDDASLLEGYLRRYPKGVFSDIAKSRLKAREKKVKRASTGPKATTKKNETAKRKVTTPQDKVSAPERSTSTQTGARCRDSNVARCRVRCAQGEKRACDKLKRMGF